jgi:predicted acylesterase/phospholipase RssA
MRTVVSAGVYEALTEAGLDPDWIAGISIGSINGALIAGNAPETRGGRTLLSFMGITDITFVRAEKLGLGPQAREQSIGAPSCS